VLTIEEFINSITTNPRNRFGLKNPEIKEGSPADISLFNPEHVYTFSEDYISSTSKNSIFINKKLHGKAYGIFSNNQLILNT
jgi:dihydroorotase